MIVIVPFLSSGCSRKVDTDPECVFRAIHDDVTELTGHEISKHDRDCDYSSEIAELLKAELTGNHVISIALMNNRNLQALYEDLGIGKAQLVQAGLLKNPILDFSYRFSTKTSVTDLIDISLIQNFLEILLIPLKKSMAEKELEATQAMVTSQVLEVIAQAKMAFFSLQGLQEIWGLKKDLMRASGLSFEVAKRLFKAGNITELEVSIEQMSYERAKLDLSTLEIEILKAREKLNILMGLWGKEVSWKFCSQWPEIPEVEEEFNDIENRAITTSFELQYAYKKLLAAAARWGIDTTRMVFPILGIGPSTERDEGVWYVGPAFSFAIPFFDFGKAQSAMAQAEISREWNYYTGLAIEIRSEARIARFDLLNASRQLHYLRQVVVPLAKQTTHLSLLQHNAMQLGVFYLLNTKKNEIEKQIEAIGKQAEYWILRTKLEMLIKGHMTHEPIARF